MIASTPNLPARASSRGALAAALVLAALLPLSNPAAASASASVSFDSFSYVVSGGALVWDTASAYQMSYTTAADAGGLTGYDSKNTNAFDWNASTLNATTASSSGTASVLADQRVAATATSATTSGAAFAMGNESFASALSSGQFSLTQAGTVTFSAVYTLTLSGDPNGGMASYGEALASLTLSSFGNPAAGGTVTMDHFSYDTVSGTATYTGTLSQSLALAAGEVGAYDLLATAAADAPVLAVSAIPEPSTYALMAAGLASVVGVARRRARRAC